MSAEAVSRVQTMPSTISKLTRASPARLEESEPAMTRFTGSALILALCLSADLQADDVSWLGEITVSPQSPELPEAGVIRPLPGSGVKTPEQWSVQRESLRREWFRFLGPMPDRGDLNAKVLQSEVVEGIRRELIEYDAEAGQRVQGYLLRPEKPAASLPAIVALHPTNSATIDEIAGVRGREQSMIGWKLARRGFVVFCPRCFLWQDASSYDEAVAAHREKHPRTLGMARMLFDAQRGVDMLCSLEYVDVNRIGAIGHSLGAKETLYLAAFDDRVCCGVFSEGGMGLRSTNWDAPWYLGNAIHQPEFPRNHHELLALIAPRPFLVIGGESGPGAADGERSWVLLNAARPVWDLFGQPVRLGLLNHHQGHAVPDDVFERMAEWLQVYCAER